MPGSLQLQWPLLALKEGLVLIKKRPAQWGIAKEVGVPSVERDGFVKLQLFHKPTELGHKQLSYTSKVQS